MKIQFTDSKRLKRICNHEAGHYIVAREMSFKTHGIRIQINLPIGHSGESTIEPCTPGIKNIDDLELYLERRIKVLSAGVIAEATDEKEKYDSDYALNEWRKGGGAVDHAKIRELVHVLRNIRYSDTQEEKEVQKELTLIDDDLVQKSGEIVTKRIKLIFGIGNLLYNKVIEYGKFYELTEDEINKVPNIIKLYLKP